MFVWFSQPHTLLQRVKACTTEEDQEKLMQITSQHSLNAFLLPIKTVGVQVSSGSGLPAMEHSAACFHKSPIWNYFGNLNVKLYSKFKKIKTFYRWLWSRWAFKYWMNVFCFRHCLVLPVVKSKTFRESFTSHLAGLFLFEKQNGKVRFVFICTLCTLTRYTLAWKAFLQL